VLTIAPARAADRVVSLNLCTDQLAVMLAPEKIVALSQLSRDPTLSFVAPQASRIPQVRASAEAVLALHPDLILAARYGAQTVLTQLEHRSIRIQRFDLPTDFPGVARLTREVATALGVSDRAEPLIATMDATLAAAGKPPATRTAIAWEPRGYTAGPASLMGAVMRAAGLTNAATGDRMGTEALLHHKPDLLIVPDTPAFPSLATEMLRAPALASITQRAIPPALTLCAGPFTAKAVALLAPRGAP
jgi:iron complex transport system substrate-binding protein